MKCLPHVLLLGMMFSQYGHAYEVKKRNDNTTKQPHIAHQSVHSKNTPHQHLDAKNHHPAQGSKALIESAHEEYIKTAHLIEAMARFVFNHPKDGDLLKHLNRPKSETIEFLKKKLKPGVDKKIKENISGIFHKKKKDDRKNIPPKGVNRFSEALVNAAKEKKWPLFLKNFDTFINDTQKNIDQLDTYIHDFHKVANELNRELHKHAENSKEFDRAYHKFRDHLSQSYSNVKRFSQTLIMSIAYASEGLNLFYAASKPYLYGMSKKNIPENMKKIARDFETHYHTRMGFHTHIETFKKQFIKQFPNVSLKL
jgi:uncharacterized membrane-anchored protein YjiN (DUF445 family)